jgi:enoyl-CoA hydratase/carnithine racemase
VQAKYDTLLAEDRPNHILLVTFSRPEVANAFNTRAAVELCDVFHRIGAEQRYRCVVLTGAGDRAFCAGADLKERNTLGDGEWRAQHETFERMFASVRDCPLPVLAAVNGAAYAGGLELVLLCDFAYASRLAKFALTEVSLGIMPGGGGTQNLPRAVGERRAKELILTGRAFTAEDALAWGLANRVCALDRLLEESLATAHEIAGNAPLAVRQAKKAAHYGLQMDLMTGLRFEIEAYNRLVGTEDRLEGVRAFNEKRKPAFRGR